MGCFSHIFKWIGYCVCHPVAFTYALLFFSVLEPMNYVHFGEGGTCEPCGLSDLWPGFAGLQLS